MPTVALGVIAILIIVGFGIFLMSKPCVEEGGSIYYTENMQPSGHCCDDLVEKQPHEYVGGSFCVKPECEIECTACGSYSEGLYIVCPDGSTQLIHHMLCC